MAVQEVSYAMPSAVPPLADGIAPSGPPGIPSRTVGRAAAVVFTFIAIVAATCGHAAPADTAPSSPPPATARASSDRDGPAPATLPASTAPATTNPSTQRTRKQQRDEAIERAKDEALARANEQVRQQYPGFGTRQSSIDALAKVSERSADIAEFRRTLMDRYPNLERKEWTSNDVPDARATTRPAPVPVGHLDIDLMQQAITSRSTLTRPRGS
jgi:hypothetical protein